MIEWMYSEPPGADPQTIISRLTGHIGQTRQGTLEAGQVTLHEKSEAASFF